MGILIKHDPNNNYCLFDIPYIRDHQEEILADCSNSVKTIQDLCNATDTNVTWFYQRYNIYSVNGGNKHFYKIFQELVGCINTFFEIEKLNFADQLWMQSWLNSHNSTEVLKRHQHGAPVNGYLSIDPKKSNTVFYYKHSDTVQYTIENKPGQLYIGPGKIDHEVINLEEYSDKRTTIAFDIDDFDYPDAITRNLGFIPLLLTSKK
jgi:hypothetical protein